MSYTNYVPPPPPMILGIFFAYLWFFLAIGILRMNTMNLCLSTKHPYRPVVYRSSIFICHLINKCLIMFPDQKLRNFCMFNNKNLYDSLIFSPTEASIFLWQFTEKSNRRHSWKQGVVWMTCPSCRRPVCKCFTEFTSSLEPQGQI